MTPASAVSQVMLPSSSACFRPEAKPTSASKIKRSSLLPHKMPKAKKAKLVSEPRVKSPVRVGGSPPTPAVQGPSSPHKATARETVGVDSPDPEGSGGSRGETEGSSRAPLGLLPKATGETSKTYEQLSSPFHSFRTRTNSV